MDSSKADPFRNYVINQNEGGMKCKFCDRHFSKHTSISRFKWHLSGEKGRGVGICEKVSQEVKEAAYHAMHGANKREAAYQATHGANKRHNAGSSNVNDNHISTPPQQLNNGVQPTDELGQEGFEQGNYSDSFPINLDDFIDWDIGNATTWGLMEPAAGTSSFNGPTDETTETRGDPIPTSTTNLVGQTSEENNNVNDNPISTCLQHQNNGVQPTDEMGQEDLELGNDWAFFSRINNDLMAHYAEDATGGLIMHPDAVPSSSNVPTEVTTETRGDPIPTSTTKPVGQAFEEKMNEIWSWLKDDEVSSVGVYGMGGVGKTAMVQHIHNQLLERPDIPHQVHWVTVSQDFSIHRLQKLIAKRLDLNLSNEDDELHRATQLSKKLNEKQKWILILDDLWDSFDLQEVGIVLGKGCKLIVTSRSKTICRRMKIQHQIPVVPLSKEEAWTLFMEKLGHGTALSPDVERIAIDVARECAGLPLGIITMAGSMRGVDDQHEWRYTLNKLRQSENPDMEDGVLRVLKYSYDRLNNPALQQCLLYCALLPEDHAFDREELIRYWIDEGIIRSTKSRKEEFDEGHTMINRLEYVCLLENHIASYGVRYFKMHDLIRDMALRLGNGKSEVMVKAGAQLEELPAAEEWTENLVRVSLINNQIEEIPSSHSPRCPRLSTLLLCCNTELQFIADSFFREMHGLKVLDLSLTNIKILPDSISDLVTLTALLLKSCEKLRHVPSLKKLNALKRLDLRWAALEKMPQGMECLSRLKFLGLNGCGEKEFQNGILSKLSHLQVFLLEEKMFYGECCSYAPVTVKGKDVAWLRKLEILQCHFEHVSDLAGYLENRDGTESLRKYKIYVGNLDAGLYLMMDHKSCTDKVVWLVNLSVNRDGDIQVKLPNDIQELIIIRECNGATSLCNVFSLKYLSKLEMINIWECSSVESLVSSSLSNGIFSGLKRLYCRMCKSIKKLFPLVLLQNLINLEEVIIENCKELEEIVARDEEGVMGEDEESNSTEFNLPKLKILRLVELPNLKTICDAKLICNSLKNIEVLNCQKLKRMSICLPLPQDDPPSFSLEICPKEWWDTVVEWEHKDVLLPFVKFQESSTDAA